MLNYYSKTKADLEHILKELGDIAVSESSKIIYFNFIVK